MARKELREMTASKRFDPRAKGLPLISVIVPVYNVADYLGECLDSVLGQTYQNLEVVVCDDGSTDGRSPALCDAYARRDARMKVLHKQNGGLSSCRNTALDACTGEWVCFVDGDDELMHDAVETLYRACAENGTAMSMGAYRECYSVFGSGSVFRPVFAPKGVYHTAQDTQHYFLTKGMLLTHIWTKMFRRDLFDAVRFPEGRIYEDIFTVPRLFEAAGSCAIVNHAVYRYKVRKGSISSGTNIRRQMDGLYARWAYVDYMREHHPELVGLANDAFLIMAADNMGRIEQLGIENARAEWDEVIRMFNEALPQCALRGAAFKIGAWLYKKNPRIISKSSRVLLRLGRVI